MSSAGRPRIPDGSKPEGRTRRLRTGARVFVQPVLAATALVALVFGCVGYHEYFRHHGLPSGPVDVLYAQLELFRLGERPEGRLPWTLQTARALVPIVVGYGVFRATVAVFRERLDRVKLQTRRGHVLVVGSGDATRSMASALRDQHRNVVLLRHEVGSALAPAAPLAGVLSFGGDASRHDIVEEAGLGRAATVVALTDDDALNLALVLRARSRAVVGGRRLRAVAAVSRASLCRSLRVDGLNDAANKQSIDYVNTADLAARSMVAELAPALIEGGTIIVDAPAVLAAQVAVRIARMAVVMEAGSNAGSLPSTAAEVMRPRVTVCFIGVDGPAAIDEARLWAPGIDHDADLICGSNAPMLGAPLDSGAGSVVGTVLVRDGVESVAGALILAEQLPRTAVIVVGAADAATLAPLLPRGRSGAHVVTVDIESWARDVDLVVGGTVEVIARATHANYRAARTLDSLDSLDSAASDDPSLAPWQQLGPELKESNRAQARHVSAKLSAVGCALVPSGLPFAVLDEVEIDLVTRLEHERWCAERRAAGWQPGVRDTVGRTTPFLVPWDELDEDARALDRAAITGLPGFLSDTGYAVVRVAPA